MIDLFKLFGFREFPVEQEVERNNKNKVLSALEQDIQHLGYIAGELKATIDRDTAELEGVLDSLAALETAYQALRPAEITLEDHDFVNIALEEKRALLDGLTPVRTNA